MYRFFALCWFASFQLCQCKVPERGYLDRPQVVTEATYEATLERWRIVENKMQSGMDTLVGQLLPMLIRSSSEVDISDECSASILRMVLGLKQFKEWAILMVDATGKLFSGMFSGTSSEMGNYDQCINIAEYSKDDNELLLQGQYCMVDFKYPLPKRTRFFSMHHYMPPSDNYTTDNYVMKVLARNMQYSYFISYRFGVCVPSTCEHEDVEKIANYVATQIGINVHVPSCEIKEEVHLDTIQIVMLAIVGTLVFLCIVGTAVDVIPKLFTKDQAQLDLNTKSLAKRILICFSVEKNVNRLLNVDSSGHNELNCLHGIRFLSMTWVILGHTYLFVNGQLMRSFLNARDIIASFGFQIIINALVAVDTFFFISGLLMSYLVVQYVDSKGGKGFNIPLILFRRVWRLLPSTMMIIGLTLLVPLISSGPVWHETTDTFAYNCRHRWWSDMLFINNFVEPSKMCLPHTWYTAADTQLFLAAIIYLFIFFKSAKFGVAFNVFLVILSLVATSVINYWRGFPPVLLISYAVPEDMLEYWHFSHCNPVIHLSGYCVGLAMGTYLARHRKTQIPMLKNLLYWCLAIICNMSIMFATYEWNRGNDPSVAMSTFYSGVHKLGWAVGVAWMTFACVNGYGGIINRILSWKAFIPLSRLTFLAYLWHYPVIIIYTGTWKSGTEGYHIFMVWMFFGNLFITFALSAISYVLYDAPSVQLERILLSVILKPRVKSEKESENQVKFTNAQDGSQLPSKDINGTYVVRM